MSTNIAKLILRLIVGGLMLFHGIAKIGGGIGGIKTALASHGLPTFIAYGVFVGEIVAPLLMVVGYMTVPAAWVFAFNMLVAILLAHAGEIFSLADKGGGYALELQALYLFGSVAIALLGPGKYSVTHGRGRFD